MQEKIRVQIKLIEKEIKYIKDLHLMNHLSTEDAKRKVRELEEKIFSLLETLPAHEREIFLLDREVYGV
ncbi:MAG: hypothetical protein HY832_03345 [Candidatus Aenigmarchaeota archaeon]|nr:hypothetical protein [Candidatus Aenigmarchaeota archaeon]